MGRMYAVPIAFTSQTAQVDIFEITAASNKPCLIHSIELQQSTEVGDAQEEQLVLLLKRGTSATTSGSGGSAPTPVPQDPNDAAAAFTAEVHNTTKMTGGTITTERPWSWNVRQEFVRIFTPETRPKILPGERKTLELATTPADAITIGGTIMVEEL